jgi:hypothetical protein
MPYLTNEIFIKRAIEKYGSFYNYSKINYINTKTKVEIVCPIHGTFFQTPKQHLLGHNCLKCSIDKRVEKRKMLLDEFISRAREIHKNKYDYSKVEFTNAFTYIIIICPIHGEFQQRVTNHLQGYGCAICGGKLRKNNEKFIQKAIEIHGPAFDYSSSLYKNNKKKIEVRCKKCNNFFFVRPDNHLFNKSGCPFCSVSEGEEELRNFIKELGFIVEKIRINHFEIDIFIAEKNIGIEYNGLYWHSQQNLLKRNADPIKYHLNKLNLFKEKGICLIQIFEDEWIHKKEIVKNRLKIKLGIFNRRIGGREIYVREINSIDKNTFLNKYHIQGTDKSSIKLGAFLKKELISVMTLANPRISLGLKNSIGDYELTRFASISETSTPGIANKMFSFFVKNYNPNMVYSYSDKRWTTGSLYLKLGFFLCKETNPNYWYVRSQKRYHRFNFCKQRLSKLLENFDSSLTEYQNMLNNNYDRIWDCGSDKFIWIKK